MDYAIACAELAERIDRGAVVIDVMTPEDYAACHVAGAKSACVYEMVFLERIAELLPDPAVDVVVYDATGSTDAAASARRRLLQAGYPNVALLEGGLSAWKRAGMPVEGDGRPSLPDTRPADGVYRIDVENSVVEWTGRSLNYRHYGRIGLLGGELTVDGGGLSGADMALDMASLTDLDLTEPDLRDMLLRHLKSEDFFATDRFPTASLRLVGWEPRPGLSPETPGGVAVCDLTIRDVARPADARVVIGPQLDSSLKIYASLEIDRTLWNVRYGSGKWFERLGMHLVHDVISLEAFLLAYKA